MIKGWILLHKKLEENFIWENPYLLKLFLYLLFHANDKESSFTTFNGKKVELKRGQLIIGQIKLSKIIGVSQPMIYKYLRLLKSNSVVHSESNNQFSIITIIKFDDYQLIKKRSYNESNSNGYEKVIQSKEKKESNILFRSTEQLKKSKRRHLQVIGKFFTLKGLQFDSEAELDAAVRRNLKPASEVAKFGEEKIKLAFERSSQFPEWTLETVYKSLSSQKL